MGGVVAVLVLAVAIVAAGAAAPWEIEERDFDLSFTPRTVEPIELPEGLPEPGEQEAPGTGSGGSLDLSWLGPLVGAAVAVGLLLLLAWLWRRYQRSRPVARTHQPPDQEVVAGAESEPELPPLREGITQARARLAEDREPGDAIIGAWQALEAAAADAGVPRAAAQTPTEFTLAILDRIQADPTAARELLHLYHRARFSPQPVTPLDVAAAGRCLAVLAPHLETADAARNGPQ